MSVVKNIAKIVYNNISSYDAIPGIINDGLSIPLGYGYVSFAVFDTESGVETETQRIGMMTPIKLILLTTSVSSMLLIYAWLAPLPVNIFMIFVWAQVCLANLHL